MIRYKLITHRLFEGDPGYKDPEVPINIHFIEYPDGKLEEAERESYELAYKESLTIEAGNYFPFHRFEIFTQQDGGEEYFFVKCKHCQTRVDVERYYYDQGQVIDHEFVECGFPKNFYIVCG